MSMITENCGEPKAIFSSKFQTDITISHIQTFDTDLKENKS